MKSKKVTSRDVAREAGVSQSAVSMILNNTQGVSFKQETIDVVWETAKRLSYQPNLQARSMKMNKANSIGLVSLWEATSFVFSPVMEGLQRVCSERNYSITLCTGNNNEQKLPDFIQYYLQNRIDGLVFISYIGADLSETIHQLNHYKIPFVSVIGGMDIDDINGVNADLYQGAYIATEHLIKMGYKNIVFIEPEGDLNFGERNRIEGYMQALTDYEGQKDSYIYKMKSNNKQEGIYNLMTLLRTKAEIDAIVASHTYYGYLAITAAQKLRIKVPEQLGVISCDHDTYAPYTAVSLSTADVPLYEMGNKAGEILFELMDNPLIKPKKIEIPSKLSIRESTQ